MIEDQLLRQIKELQEKLADQQSNNIKMTRQMFQIEQKYKNIDMEQDE